MRACNRERFVRFVHDQTPQTTLALQPADGEPFSGRQALEGSLKQ